MKLKAYSVIKHIKSVLVKIPLLQFSKIPRLEKIKITSEYLDARNDIYK